MSEPERTEDEWRRLLASMRVAGAPDPAPHRSPPVRAVLTSAWAELEGGPRADRVATARIMRAASTEERALLTHLRGAR